MLEMRAIFIVLWGITVFGLQGSLPISLPNDPTYYAGVVEFIPAMTGTAKQRVSDNLKRMKSIIESDATAGLDILVFPEYTLTNMEMKTYVPDPKLKLAPCEMPNYDFYLTELSCSARSRGVYLVVNLLEKVRCAGGSQDEVSETLRGCNTSGFNVFNTNVVLDRQGRIISRYRKSHLYRYEWYSTDTLRQLELATFTTDFGVTFGHFICFDMLFYEPAMQLINELNVTDIIYPTYWFSELPFLTAVQLQEGWAYANNVNLLAADASNPSGQNTGSGIYAGRLGRLNATIVEDPTTVLLTARVPKRGHAYTLPAHVQPIFMPERVTERYTKLNLLRDYNVDIFTTQLLPTDFSVVTSTLCHTSAFCCDFNVSRIAIRDPSGATAAAAAYRYRLVAYSGEETTFQRVDRSAQRVCAIIACTNDELLSCGRIFSSGVTVANKYYFSAITIVGDFGTAPRRLIMPSSIDGRMMPLSVDTFNMTQLEGAKSTHVTLTLTTPKSDLLTFGIWANYYSAQLTTHNLDVHTATMQKPVRGGAVSAAISSKSVTALVAVLAMSVLRLLDG